MRRFWRSLVLFISVFGLLFVVIAPFYWIFSSSVKRNQEIIARIPTFFPKSFTIQHYQNLLASSDFPKYLMNSTIVALLTMIFTVVITVMAAYAIYRLKFPGHKFLQRVILVTYAFPTILLLIPIYMMLSATTPKLIDTPWALVIVNVTFAAPFAVWMLQAFFKSIPLELEEAAALDGAGRIQTMIKVFLPLAAPGIASIAIYAFIFSWTEYMYASVLIISDKYRTLPVGLAGIIGQYQVDWGLLLAGATITTLPVLILFSIVGRSFVQGLTAGAVK
ncbi:MAG: putative transporter permease protein [Chloroflexi bacterium]|nr:putative transporter permease protein [Chloroflexota bacterium]